MKYLSILIAIVMSWVAVIAMSTLIERTEDIYYIYLLTVIFTVILSVIGFLKK